MVKTRRVKLSQDGMYHISGKKYFPLVGSRRQVWNGTTYKTPGGLTKKQLFKNKHGNIVSLKKHKTEKRLKRLAKLGYKPKKGNFILMRRHKR